MAKHVLYIFVAAAVLVAAPYNTVTAQERTFGIHPPSDVIFMQIVGNLGTAGVEEVASGEITCGNRETLSFDRVGYTGNTEEWVELEFDDGMVLEASWEHGSETVLSYQNPFDDALGDREDTFVQTPPDTAVGCRPSSVEVRDALNLFRFYVNCQPFETGSIKCNSNSDQNAPYEDIALWYVTVKGRMIITRMEGFTNGARSKAITFDNYVELSSNALRPTKLTFHGYRGRRLVNPTIMTLQWVGGVPVPQS